MRYFILLFSLTIFSCSTKKKDCKNFKTGTFKYTDLKYKGHTITRNDSIQIEINDKDNIKIITLVEWISDCEYVLTYKDILNYPNKENIIGQKINVKILESKELSYVCHVKSSTLDSKIEIIKIE